ncbi:S-adenosyl-L-homocysteine hydrolase [Altererythrobacter sp. ZODW24]|uniref:S-adenosyl-L-homocysteine hydrolase n=1 Tax=Altererythrobacter sp. ZODW24 TaxID=2185142 RepID=UPI000DF82617|nr:S-adenosyl-L-homocysteine hydrolase [Altererythrobacter sp. ZODW24]
MNFYRTVTITLAAATLFAGSAAALAQPHTPQTASQVRSLDIMLMVSSLRCRTGPHDFRLDYQRFSANHLTELNVASRTMKADLARKHGTRGSKRALDKVSIGMANRFGGGHPYLDCAGLKKVTSELADQSGAGVLLSAATELLAQAPSTRYAMLARK